MAKQADARLESLGGRRAPSAPAPAAGAAFANRERSDRAAAVARTPGATVIWQFGEGGYVARSSDGGTTWTRQWSGVSVSLAGGAAPSTDVCWAVGSGGTVILTEDGERWKRRPFPEELELVSVDADDARVATVTARDGRRYTTADGGSTWHPAKPR
jgi:photosystem II stability/assembly factor-like uncharacterized protein